MSIIRCASAAELLRRVLIVDDEPSVLSLVSETLRPRGYEVAAATNGLDALELVGHEQFAVILSDQRMPNLSGLEFFKRVKVEQPHAARILLTGVTDLSMMIEAINEGEIYRFVVKPWLPMELLNAVEQGARYYGRSRDEAAQRAEVMQMNEQLAKSNRILAGEMALGEMQNRELTALTQALGQNLQRSVEMCVKTVETFYPPMGMQARRVAALCKVIGVELQLPTEQRQVLEISGWLHDIGLLGMPDELVGRWYAEPGELNADETALIQRHPAVGQELLGFTGSLQEVGTVIRAHHERLDGTGYPDGIAGDSIPWLARLLAVAVSYAHCQHEDHDGVLEIRAHRGTVYDPEAVDVVLRCLPQAVFPRQEQGVRLAELQPGMVLATGVYNSQGMLILPEGHVLNDVWIDRLKADNRVSPLNDRFRVQV